MRKRLTDLGLLGLEFGRLEGWKEPGPTVVVLWLSVLICFTKTYTDTGRRVLAIPSGSEHSSRAQSSLSQILGARLGGGLGKADQFRIPGISGT